MLNTDEDKLSIALLAVIFSTLIDMLRPGLPDLPENKISALTSKQLGLYLVYFA